MEFVGIANAICALMVAIFIIAKYELIVLHPSKIYHLNGVRCSDKETADFLARNMKKSFERGQMMYAILNGRGNKTDNIEECKFGNWPVQTIKTEWVYVNDLRAVETFMLKSIWSGFYTFNISTTGYVILGTFRK